MERFRLRKSSRIGALLLAGALALAAVLWWRARPAEPYRVILSAQESPSDGLDPSQRRALRDWVQWQLEAGGCTVLLPGPAPAKDLPPRTRLLELRPRRVGDQLSLAWREASAGDLADEGEGAWDDQSSSLQAPAVIESAKKSIFSR